jgi:hypothetical protein
MNSLVVVSVVQHVEYTFADRGDRATGSDESHLGYWSCHMLPVVPSKRATDPAFGSSKAAAIAVQSAGELLRGLAAGRLIGS